MSTSLPIRPAFHLPFAAPTYSFRVVAELVDRSCALVCVGSTRDEVLALARGLTNELPASTVTLRLQEWVGGSVRGRWCDRACPRRELFAAPGRPPRQREPRHWRQRRRA